MAIIASYETKKQLYKSRAKGAVLTSSSRNDQVSAIVVPPKVAGSFLTLPGGSKFRQATAYSRSSTFLTGHSGQNMSGVVKSGGAKGQEVLLQHSPGGYRADLLFYGQTNAAWKVTGGFESLNRVPVIRANERNQVVTKGLLEIADQKVNLGENLATYRQTVGLLTDPGGSLLRLVKELKKVGKNRKFREFLRLAKRDFGRHRPVNTLASEYLRYVYGWKPLMQDVYNLIKMTQESGGKPLLLESSSTVKTVEETNQVTWYASSFDTKVSAGPLKVQTTTRSSMYARVDPNHATLLALSQLGLVNPASLAWELVPFSFVVDWLIPIGPVLQAMTARAGLIFVDGSVSSRVSARGPYELNCDILSSSIYVATGDDSPSMGQIRYEGYTRETLRTWPKPGLYIDFNPLREDRPVKAAALAIVGLTGLVPPITEKKRRR